MQQSTAADPKSPFAQEGTMVSREMSVVAACARTSRDDASRLRLEALLSSGPRWNEVMLAAAHHGIVPLVNWHISGMRPNLVPESVKDAFRRRSVEAARHTLAQSSELIRLAEQFDRAQIPCVVFKGVAFAARYYPRPELRESSDIDLLVQRQHIEAATELLIAVGYSSWKQLPAGQLRAYRRRWHAQHFGNSNRGVGVDLHWRIDDSGSSSGVHPDLVWSRATMTAIGSQRILTIPPDVLLLVLCAHASRHSDPWSRLKWVTDVAQVTRTLSSEQWEAVLGTAERRDCLRSTLLGVSLARQVLGIDVPPQVLARVQEDATLGHLHRIAMTRLVNRGRTPIPPAQRLMFAVALNARFANRVRVAFGALTTPRSRDWEAISLPAHFAWLYTLIRITRLATNYIRPSNVEWLIRRRIRLRVRSARHVGSELPQRRPTSVGTAPHNASTRSHSRFDI